MAAKGPKKHSSQLASLKVEDVIGDLSDTEGLLAAQVSLGLDKEEVVEAMFSDVEQKLGTITTATNSEKSQ